MFVPSVIMQWMFPALIVMSAYLFFRGHDLPGGGVRLALDDPTADTHPDADALVGKMAAEPRIGVLRGFVPPPEPR